MTDLCDCSATRLLELYRSRQTSPSEVWASVESRIAGCEPQIAALWAYDPEDARRQAKASTERWSRGGPMGALDGVPTTIKELIATEGLPVPNGTAASDLTPAHADAPAAARLKQAGALIFARTTCPDYGMLSSGLSSFHALSRNPWDLTKNPGGSSAGAGAAAAAGYGPLHLGTDIGGSIRIPAALCGLVGFKPSFGRVPLDPAFYGRVAGPMTRTIEDAALMMATLALPDARDPTSLPPTVIDWQDLALDLAGLRIGLMETAGCGLDPDDDGARVLADCAGALRRAGAIVEPVAPVLDGAMLDGFDRFFRARFWAQIETLSPQVQGRILPYILEWAEAARTLTGSAVAAAFDQLFAIKRAALEPFERFDAVLSPVNPVSSWPADWASPIDDPMRPFEHIGFTLPWNFGEQPAVSVNGGFTRDGLPVGVQIVAPRFADAAALQIAAALRREIDATPDWAEAVPVAAPSVLPAGP